MPDTTIMPAFKSFPQEASLIGRLLAGYGELEFQLMICLREVLDQIDIAIRVIFRARGEEHRILIADAFMREYYNSAGLIHPYSEAIADMSYCRQIRNQYAHCHWSTFRHQLQFANLEETAKSNLGSTSVKEYSVNIPLLKEQETYFLYVRDCLSHLSNEYARLQGRLRSHVFPLPKKIERPPKYNANP